MGIPGDHEKYMRRCLELAARGLGRTAPNPMAGCVIVNNNRIIGEGFHGYFGGPHAEVMAVKRVQDHSLLKNSILYVNLEPCSHYGKTPPCARLIIENKIPAVVAGTPDPNPVVCGKGIRILKENGTEVITGILKEECCNLNKRFFTFYEKKRPYIILKWAQTQDGFIDIERKENEVPEITWITNETCRRLVHKWRTEEQSILVGSGTVIKDNPRLTARNWPGKNPLRLVIDRKARLSGSLNVLDGSVETVVFTHVPADEKSNLKYVLLDRDKDVIPGILDWLFTNNVQSVIVEGGRILIAEFLSQGIWDEARVFTGTETFGKGLKAPLINSDPDEVISIAENLLKIYLNRKPCKNTC